MAQVQANGSTIEYEAFGPEGGEPMLLIMGLGCQLTRWPLPLVDQLVAKGFRVIRFDNRDVGLSTHFREAGVPDLMSVAAVALSGGTPEAPYRLTDMAADALGLMDALGLASAHLVGVSMGGMIAQVVAVTRPERVRSMTLIMTTTGELHLPGPTPEAAAMLMTPYPSPKEVEAFAAHGVKVWRTIGSTGFEIDDAAVRERVLADAERAYDPGGFARQLAAIYASGERASSLKAVKVPTVVVHGEADPLVPVDCGKAVAAAIPGAELRLIPGMGHDLPPQLYGAFVDAIMAAVEHSRVPAG